MSESRMPLSTELEALLEHERAVPSLPPQVRARAIERARAALVAGRLTPPADAHGARSSSHVSLTKAAAVCVASAVIGAVVYRTAIHPQAVVHEHPPASVVRVAPSPAAPPVAVAPALPSPSMPAPSVAASVAPSPEATPQPSVHGGSGADELRLLRKARAAVAQRDFGSALARITEHTRKWKDGRLTEEREALRVKALAGLGRLEEARSAAKAFEARFPRSVLLPAVRQMADSAP